MKTLSKIILPAAFIVLFASCAKDGEPGPQGPAGQNGINGQDGNANVQSYLFTVYSNMWSGSGSNFKYVVLNVPQITQSVVDSGMVLVYRVYNGYNALLPITNYTGSDELTISFLYQAGEVEIDINSTAPITNLLTYYFRVVVVTGHVRMAYAHLNWSNYEEVKNAFNFSMINQ